ncbi:hypothetical protein [Bradyrhizobium sp. CCBAU 21362]|uniref:hypothetical protein n=1 Tax=Bradyrhizobium sp. CCBAU 21362 TaxID=1325082 RepID=UPI002305AF71|nr:hypothetical protein [Bradyrhizobium sp. CCBAU 21362]
MDSSENDAGYTVTLAIPDIARLADEELAPFARFRDGRWSAQTKALLAQFSTTKLDLNRGWASTREHWTCPCCKRGKAHIARVSSGGVLLCRLEYHHDHLADRAKRLFREHRPQGGDRETIIQIGRAENALMLLVERFEQTLICIDCNLAEGRAKLELAKEIDSDFTFTPAEIASFIGVTPNRLHEVDLEKAKAAWLLAREDVADRLDFTRRMAQRIASGRHRRQVAAGERLVSYLQDRDIIYDLFQRASPDKRHFGLANTIEARSTSYDSAGNSPKPKRKPRGDAPTEAEFAEIDRRNQEHKPWVLAGNDWSCPCCDRSKREICRKSNRGLWTAHIHRVCEFEPEENDDSLWRRRTHATSQIIIGSHANRLVCQDCRNIIAEVKRRTPGLTENNLTIDNVRLLAGAATPHVPHDVDWENAIMLALGNRPLIDAIDDYYEHRANAFDAAREVKELMEIGWPKQKARDLLGYEYAKANDIDLDEGDAHIDWLLDEAERHAHMDRLGM